MGAADPLFLLCSSVFNFNGYVLFGANNILKCSCSYCFLQSEQCSVFIGTTVSSWISHQ